MKNNINENINMSKNDYINDQFKIGNKKINFNLSNYLKNSLGIPRNLMPQVKIEEVLSHLDFIKSHINVSFLKLPVNLLKPIQNEINLSKVAEKLVKNQENPSTNDTIFICSNDFHIIDGHHRHVELLMSNPTELVQCYVFDLTGAQLYNLFINLNSFLGEFKDIKDNKVLERFYNIVLEDFGIQGPEAVPGIGDVFMPGVARNPGYLLDPNLRGSGDIISPNGTIYKSKALLKDEDEESVSEGEKNTEENVSEGNEKNEILEVHYTKDLSSELRSKLKSCINKVVVKKYLETDRPFSCETMEGIVQGKAGDLLMIGVDGEIYPIDNEIFHQTYQPV